MSTLNFVYTRFRLYGHRIYGLFEYLVNFWVVPIYLNILKLTIYPGFDLNFGYMVNFEMVPTWTIYPEPSVQGSTYRRALG